MKKKIGLLLLAVVVVLAAGLGAYGWNYYNKYVDIAEIYPGVKIQGMDVGGKTEEEAQRMIDEYVENVSKEKVTLKVEDKEKSFALSEIGLELKNPNTSEEAGQLGKTGNVLKRILQIRKLSREGTDIPLQFSVDETQLAKFLKKKGKSFLTKKKDAQITREEDKFKIKKEVNGISIDFDKNADDLAEIIEDDHWDQKAVVFPMDYQVDYAEHTEKELSSIKDVLGTFTTSYAGSSGGRCTNVENGTSLLDGTVLYPDETLSVYEKVSPFNRDNGYRLAGSYSNGKTIQTYGGGICQVSTTLYNAVLRSELDVLERENHSMTVHYVKLSEDAAISGTDKDLKFKNNLDTPIYIEGKTSGSTVTFTIYGKEYRDAKRTIEFISQQLSSKSPKEKQVKDNTLEEGKTVVEQQGSNGYTAKLWKVIYEDGEETDRIQINSSSYQPSERIVRVGTKKKKQPVKKEDSKTEKKDKKTTESDKKNTTKKETTKKEETQSAE